MSNRRGRTRAEQVRLKRLLLVLWAVFLVVVLCVIFIIIKNKDSLMEDFGVKKNTIYEVDINPDINKLISDYYTAYAACDQKALQTMVVDPSLFDDMSIVEKKADVVTAYNNLKVYTIPGLKENETVAYVVTNISIANVVSKPLDIIHPPLYIVKKNGKYLIDNSSLSTDILNYINSLDQKEDIVALMKLVRDDQEKCLAEDETFRNFYNRLNQTGSSASGD